MVICPSFLLLRLSSWTYLRTGLLVPASSDKMLRKSLETPSDVIIYDLEDSVPPTRADKDAARDRLLDFLTAVRSCRRLSLHRH
jgi:citrate lyase beta subunit